MMQPIDPLSQLAMCCGFGRYRRRYEPPRSFFYSPSTALIDPGNSWPVSHNHYGPQPQPYFLFTQPVIIANNPLSNPTNTMTLVQHAQTTSQNTNTFPTISILGGSTTTPHQAAAQPSIVSSQYAIYSTPAGINTSMVTNSPPTLYEHPTFTSGLDHHNTYPMRKVPTLTPLESGQTLPSQSEHKTVTLNSEIFRQLEAIERQVDLSRDMELVEGHGIVISRALDPYSLMPHLNEATLRKYQSHFLFSDNYVIRFIEIIKRPGQTLGLYIRTVHFDDPQGRGSRGGLVITKIDSDSPIYNSQVLHVGDEILSVNLVDVQGMSLDDVVIIMSIPKRLVLAIQIPRDRDQLLSINLMQQQQILRNSMEQREASLQTYQLTRPQTAPLNEDLNSRQTSTPMISSNRHQNQTISNLRLADTPEQSSYFSSSIDAINRELKELRRQRMALSNNEHSLNSARVEF